jgi:endoglucanase
MTITPVNHTDQNWVNGVAKSWGAAFFVPNPSDAKKVIAVGKRVTFSNGTTRTITSIKENSGALIVNLDGAPLDGNVVGYPNKIAVH